MRIFRVLCAFIVLAASQAFAANISAPLSPPVRSGGVPVLDAIERRHSSLARDFFSGDVTQEQLSTLLWAASGRNRGGRGWVVPTVKGKDPYVAVYVLADNGVFLYNGEHHSLQKISPDGAAKSRAPMQEFARSAAYILAFVRQGSALEGAHSLSLGDSFGYTLVGAMTQNIYLAAPSVGVGVRYLVAFDEKILQEALKLEPHATPLCIMPLTSLAK